MMSRLFVVCLTVLAISDCFGAEMACSDPAKSEKALKDLALLPITNTILVPLVKQEAMTEFTRSRAYAGWCHDQHARSDDIRLTGPYLQGTGSDPIGFMPHGSVRIFYSNDVVEWLQNDRKGDIPDGAMIVKEMYHVPGYIDAPFMPEPSGWAIMVRDKNATHAGWLWFLYYHPQNPTYGYEYEQLQYGTSFCLACHASVDNNQSTFSFLGNLTDEDVATYVTDSPTVIPWNKDDPPPPNPPSHVGLVGESGLLMPLMYQPLTPPLKNGNLALANMLETRLPGLKDNVEGPGSPLPPDAFYDHIVSPSGKDKAMFITSDNCQGCHDAANLIVPPTAKLTVKLPPEKQYQMGPAKVTQVNVSPYGEWSASMMAKSGRDPVFLAQLESERALVPDAAAKTTQLCSRCHGVMGKRTYPKLAEDIDNYFAVPPTEANPPAHEMAAPSFGALARDGVSCAVCHHISDKDLGKKSTYTGQFNVGKANEFFGPYEDVVTYPMEQALGITPKHGKAISNSALCGSCHTVEVPVYHNGKEVKQTLEQTTYLEWKNSEFARGDTKQECLDCHMPRDNPVDGKPLNVPIARVEDGSFPYVPNRANAALLDAKNRPEYRRHTLVGLSSVTMGMFQQFPMLLGSNTVFPDRSSQVQPPKILAMEEVFKLAAKTASLQVESKSNDDEISIDVVVSSETGHKFPSGVNFRRAFLTVEVLDEVGRTIWCSGCVDQNGVMQGPDGPLDSEFTHDPKKLQPDFDVITHENQAQIYESRHSDCDGKLTTSFIQLCHETKDNRILPLGWKDTKATKNLQPVPRVSKLTPGKDTVSYQIKRSEALADAAAVKVSLNYQSLPPYFLVDRFSGMAKGETVPQAQRLYYLTTHLNVDAINSSSWKVDIACQQGPLNSKVKACD